MAISLNALLRGGARTLSTGLNATEAARQRDRQEAMEDADRKRQAAMDALQQSLLEANVRRAQGGGIDPKHLEYIMGQLPPEQGQRLRQSGMTPAAMLDEAERARGRVPSPVSATEQRMQRREEITPKMKTAAERAVQLFGRGLAEDAVFQGIRADPRFRGVRDDELWSAISEGTAEHQRRQLAIRRASSGFGGEVEAALKGLGEEGEQGPAAAPAPGAPSGAPAAVGPDLSAVHQLNVVAFQIASEHPEWSDQQIADELRKRAQRPE